MIGIPSYIVGVQFPTPQECRAFIEGLGGPTAVHVIARLKDVQTRAEDEEASFYMTALVAASAIFFERHYEVWSAFIEGKRHFWAKYDGVVIDPKRPGKPALRESPSVGTQQKMRTWAMTAMKEARPRKRLLANSVLKFNGWVDTAAVSGKTLAQDLADKGHEDLATQLLKILRK